MIVSKHLRSTLTRGFSWTVTARGDGFSYRAFLKTEQGQLASPWHDVPLKTAGAETDEFSAVFEIARNSTAKMEVATDEEHNPIKQDTKKDKKTGEKYLRHYMLNPCFNYGMIPQTWENSAHKDRETQAYGDNDPLDIVEISTSKIVTLGEHQAVKVLGALCLLDQGELDWKIIALNAAEAKEKRVKNMEDFNRTNPGALKEIADWFRTYKTFEGKGENTFGYEGRFLSAERTIEIIHENNAFYKELLSGKVENKSGLWLGAGSKK